ncbi:SDR family NAD(P)-dependent oxidoreductase [Nocardioides sp. CER19]|uniref:SDR family NAD(P)-dependent oxidoreductase n=1 Tax=Nocardioides sp. CER19 TaxID=3038538 RepID=UPI00244BFF8D|nr:SDR family NAD(P)-dependent oxidoreductase [Nocardioides sp. CER19]MDH2415253.1 SDR family NAD(P)-dependent oxidoreductase [Nocardioides sp. CER19]
MTSKIIIVTGASSGFGAMTVRNLADAGHTVYAGMRDVTGRNTKAAADAASYATTNNVKLRSIEMDVSQQTSVDAAVEAIVAEHGGVDVVVHNAGHMVLGPLEAFTAEQLVSVYDTNVISTQRVNHAVLPHMRDQRDGLVVWVGSSSTKGGTPPYLAPYFAAKAAEDALAVSSAAELARFGVDTSIIVPGSFTTGTNHFANAGHAARVDVVEAYDGLYAGLMDQVAKKLADLAPADADPAEVARTIVRVVDLPKGERPFRVHIDPANDGSETVSNVADLVRREFYHRVDLEDLLHPSL